MIKTNPRGKVRRQQVLAYIQEFQKANGYPPTIKQICAGCGISSTGHVSYVLDRLRDAGKLDMADRIGESRPARSIIVNDPAPAPAKSKLVRVPFVGVLTKHTRWSND